MTNTISRVAAVAGLALAVCAPFALAEQHDGEHGRRHAERLQAMDTNDDGAISREEAQAADAARFAEIDANSDGFATADEMTAHREAKHAERRERRQAAAIERLDLDGDGRISAAEFEQRERPMFDRADTDGDGLLTADELKAAGEKRGGRRHWKRD